MDDQTFEMLLVQHFGSSRYASKPKLKHVYGDGGYDPQITAWEIKLDHLTDEEMKLFDAAEFLCRPAQSDFVSKQIARLRVCMARAGESNDDVAILIDAYTEHLSEYPPDVVKHVCDIIIQNKKWFPQVAEMRAEAERAVKFRRAILRCFEECRNSLLAEERKKKLLEVDPRLGYHYKALEKKLWMQTHYEDALGEAESMVSIFRKQGNSDRETSWQEVVEMRKQELSDFLKAKAA